MVRHLPSRETTEGQFQNLNKAYLFLAIFSLLNTHTPLFLTSTWWLCQAWLWWIIAHTWIVSTIHLYELSKRSGVSVYSGLDTLIIKGDALFIMFSLTKIKLWSVRFFSGSTNVTTRAQVTIIQGREPYLLL